MSSSIEEVYNSSLKFLAPLSLEETYKTIVHEAIRLVKGTDGSIMLAKGGRLTRVYSSNPKVYKLVPRRRGSTYKSYKTKKTLMLTKEKIEKVHPEISDIEMKADLLTPLIYRSISIGVISVYTNRKYKFTGRDKKLLQAFSPLASLAIRKAQLYDELNRAIETRDLFLSLASHELKTPITTIYVYLQLIQRNLQRNKKFDPEWIETLLKEMVRLTKIVDDLLELSRIRTGKIHYTFQECNIKEVVQRAILNFKATHEHKIKFEDNLPERKKSLIGDFDKLMGVVINILDNSAKHSEASEPIFLKLSDNDGFIRITVEDRGKGIPTGDIDKIFEGFYKVENNTQPGMGLGLFLAKQVIEKHKGKIKIDSVLGQGTSISLTLPRSRQNS